MAERELSILVRAKGAAQAARDIGKVHSTIQRLGDHGRRAVSNLTANLIRIGAVAAVGIAAAVKHGVSSLAQLERANNQTAGVIASTGGVAGVTADQVRSYAEQLEAVTTADDKLIQSGENMLLTFTQISSSVFPDAAKAMADVAIAMAQGDVENANFKTSAIQIGKALNDPIRGLTSLRRIGVLFTEQQEDQIKKMVESGDIMGAQKVILDELQTEFGGAGEAAGQGLTADFRRLQDAAEEAQMALAIGLMPVLTRAAKFLTEKLQDPATIAAIKDFGYGLADGFDKAIEIAKKLPWGQMADAFKIVAGGAKAALDFFAGLPPWIQTAVMTGWGLNKLTGGALGDIVGTLSSGLIKGVLGMNAGVVNINAGVVNGGGIPGGGAAPGSPTPAGPGRLPTLVKLVAGAGVVIAGLELGTALSGINDPKHQLQNGQTNRYGGTTVRGTNVPNEQIANLVAAEKALVARIDAGERGFVEKQLAEVRAELARLRGQQSTETKQASSHASYKADQQKQATLAARDKIEANRIATISGTGRIRETTAGAGHMIVAAVNRATAAINRLDLSVVTNVTVSGNDGYTSNGAHSTRDANIAKANRATRSGGG